MKDIESMKIDYAKIIVTKGVNIKKGQCLAIKTPVATYPFASLIAKEAYKVGAKFVKIDIDDLTLLCTRIEEQTDEDLLFIPSFETSVDDEMIKDEWAYIRIDNTDERHVLKNIDSSKLADFSKNLNTFHTNMRKMRMSSELTWCVVCAPSDNWAKQVLNEKSDSDDLWRFLAPILHLDQEDPISALEEHNKVIENRAKALNAIELRSLHCKSASTDVTIGLSQYHRFEGGGENTTKGLPFYPNIPTEEVFTTPLKTGVNGVITTTKPVSLLDSLVKGARVVFKDGRVVEASAEVGNDVLQQYLKIDEGASFMGEIALVDQTSPIAMADTIFHSILYDENASCHFALGAGYPTCLLLPQGISLIEAGCNQSIVHTDFMFGSNDMSIIGTDREGKEHSIMIDGTFTSRFE